MCNVAISRRHSAAPSVQSYPGDVAQLTFHDNDRLPPASAAQLTFLDSDNFAGLDRAGMYRLTTYKIF